MNTQRKTGRLDDSAYDERAERERHRSIVLIANWNSLASTQKTIAADYRHWSQQGGSQAGYYAKEAERLESESKDNFARAGNELKELNND